MNILFITIDGARPDIIRQFPGFNDFFKKGTYFPTTITYAPYTIASLHAIFTGIYGNENGVDNYYGCKDFRRDSCKTLTQYLRDAGYLTRGDTFNRILAPGQGFDELTIYGEHEEDVIKRHTKLLREMKDDEPFFLWLHYSKIHTSLVRDVIKKYDDFSKEYFRDKEKNLARYRTYMREASDYFTEIIKECENTGLIEDTLIIVFSDHGVSIGEKIGEKVYGSYCYDYTLKTFTFFYHPKIFPPKNISTQIRNVDIMPTIMDILDIKEDIDYLKITGRSVMPVVKDEEDAERIAYSETGGLGGFHPSPKKPNIKCVRTNNWKLIYNETTKEKELYNLKKDPTEERNLVGKGLKEETRLWGILNHVKEKSGRNKLDEVIDSLDI